MSDTPEVDPTAAWYFVLWLLFLLILVVQALPLLLVKSVWRQWYPTDVDILQEQQQMEKKGL